jgi:hypothetical protein
MQLPKEAIQFSKSMGIDLSGLEPEACDLWNMLEKMAVSDPIAYQEFVRQQMETAKLDLSNEEKKKGILQVTSTIDLINMNNLL